MTIFVQIISENPWIVSVSIISKVLWVVPVLSSLVVNSGILPCHILKEALSRALSDTPGKS